MTKLRGRGSEGTRKDEWHGHRRAEHGEVMLKPKGYGLAEWRLVLDSVDQVVFALGHGKSVLVRWARIVLMLTLRLRNQNA